MFVEETELDGVVVITPRRFEDERGWLMETWSVGALREAGLDVTFVQANHSLSLEACTLRGLHYQAPPVAQDKLVRCTAGRILDVAVDARRDSSTYGRSVSVELSARNGRQLFVPKGFLHGFLTLDRECEVQYLMSAPYDARSDGAVHWDSVGIEWPVAEMPIVSEKDKNAPRFADWNSPFVCSEDDG